MSGVSGGWPVTMDPNAWLQPPSLEVVIAKVRKIINNGILVDIWVGPDDRNSNEYILQVALIQECLELTECLVREDERKCRIHKMDCLGFFMSSVNQNRSVPRPIQKGSGRFRRRHAQKQTELPGTSRDLSIL